MRQAAVFYKDREAGLLTQHDDGHFTFAYSDQWRADGSAPPISLTLPKGQGEHRSEHLFPFFQHMLPEGANKEMVCRLTGIDREDHFGLLLHTARYDSIGAVTVQKMPQSP